MYRRELLKLFSGVMLMTTELKRQAFAALSNSFGSNVSSAPRSRRISSTDDELTTLFLCGDVMTGRGIDQILPHPSQPKIYEPYMRSAKGYISIAEEVNGEITRPASFKYIWGDALAELQRRKPQVKIINLETAVTTSSDYWRGKGINYRMHPKNLPCIEVAEIDCCSLANNHALDWRYLGLFETMNSLEKAGLNFVGAGKNVQQAKQPLLIPTGSANKVIVFGLGSRSSGIPSEWAADDDKAGVFLFDESSDKAVKEIAQEVKTLKQPGTLPYAQYIGVVTGATTFTGNDSALPIT